MRPSADMFPHRAAQLRATPTRQGGEWTTGVPVEVKSEVPCLLGMPSGTEVRQADQFQGRLLYQIAFPHGAADVRRGDEFIVRASQGDGSYQVVRMRIETVLPGSFGHLRAMGELYQRGGEAA